MSVWFCIPSARPAAEAEPVFEQWQRMGYRVAVLRQGEAVKHTDIQISTPTYKGWARSINKLVKTILKHDEDVDWAVSGGDDTLPDPDHTAEEIAAECSNYFSTRALLRGLSSDAEFAKGCPGPKAATMGVMQPTGDLRAWPNSRIDTFAGSPWLGREWCRRAYGGNGPLFAGYHHCWADEELQAVAIKLGVFWQREDLTHAHLHYLRDNRHPPAYAAIIACDYSDSRALFEQRKAAGWPGSEPIL